MEEKSGNEHILNASRDSREASLSNLNNKNSSKKNIIIAVITLIAIAAIIALILVIVLRKSSDDSEDKLVTGIISCVYDISSNMTETKILGDEFHKTSELNIYINGNKIKFSKVYKFPIYGINKVEFKLYNSINMSYMFKGVSSLKSVEMISSNNEKIVSMLSTFENCINFESILISGFSANELKTMKKSFYKTNLKSIDLINFNTNNLEDISYMFASTSLEEFEFPNINTENVVDMSYLFCNCTSLKRLNISKINTSKAENLSHMYEGCKSIASLDLTL